MQNSFGAIVVFGLPSSGKGTYSKIISEKFSLPRISFSALLDSAAKKSKNKKIPVFMLSGKLVPDEIAVPLLESRIKKSDCNAGLVLEGFPRTVQQAMLLQAALLKQGKKISHAIFLGLPVVVALRRLRDRLSCKKCNLTFSASDFPPQKPGFCDNCGRALEKRKDGSYGKIKNRLERELSGIKGLKAFFKRAGVLRVFNVEGGREKVWKNSERMFRLIEKNIFS